MSKLGRPTSCLGIDTRKRLLIEARRSFASDGFDATTNKRLAQSVGITTAAIYHYFPSKVDLYVAVFTEVQDLVCETIENSIHVDADVSQNITTMVDTLACLTEREPALVAFVMSVSSEAHRHPEVLEAVRPVRGRIGRILLKVCDQAISRGEVHNEITAQALEDVFSIVLSGLARFSMVYKDPHRSSELISAMKLLLNGAAFRVESRV